MIQNTICSSFLLTFIIIQILFTFSIFHILTKQSSRKHYFPLRKKVGEQMGENNFYKKMKLL